MLNTLVKAIHLAELRRMGVFAITIDQALQIALGRKDDRAIEFIRKRYVVCHSCDRKKIFEILSQSLPTGLAIYTSGRSVINGSVKRTSTFFPMDKIYWVSNRR